MIQKQKIPEFPKEILVDTQTYDGAQLLAEGRVEQYTDCGLWCVHLTGRSTAYVHVRFGTDTATQYTDESGKQITRFGESRYDGDRVRIAVRYGGVWRHFDPVTGQVHTYTWIQNTKDTTQNIEFCTFESCYVRPDNFLLCRKDWQQPGNARVDKCFFKAHNTNLKPDAETWQQYKKRIREELWNQNY